MMNILMNLLLADGDDALLETGISQSLLQIVSYISLTFGGVVIIWALYLGFKMATASDTSKRAEAKSRIIKAISAILIIVALISLLQVIKVRFAAPANPFIKITQKFAETHPIGGSYDADGAYGAQCVDLTKLYVQEIVPGYNAATMPLGDGKDIASNLVMNSSGGINSNGNKIDSLFGKFEDKVISYSAKVAKVGDIVSVPPNLYITTHATEPIVRMRADANKGGRDGTAGAGHTAIIIAVDEKNRTVTLYEQNVTPGKVGTRTISMDSDYYKDMTAARPRESSN
jgi:hypothetical protein